MSALWQEAFELDEVAEVDAPRDQIYREILRLASPARASVLRAEHVQMQAQLDQLRSKAAGPAARR